MPPIHSVTQPSEPGPRTQMPWTSPMLSSTNATPQTFLPSIRQLHPELPPSALSDQFLPCRHGSSHISPPAPHFVHSIASSSLGPRKASEADWSEKGDGSEATVPPPKKKRRRQALSCTECKRRKIKCDRAQPCAQCSRRGEQSRCEWNIIEPIEKYVTRAEYAELQKRLEELSEQVQHLQRPGNNPRTSQPVTLGKDGEAIHLSTPSATGPIAHPALILQTQTGRPPTPFQKPSHPHAAPPTQQHRYQAGLSTPPTPARTFSSCLKQRSPAEDSTPLSPSTTKKSPLSLASIISQPSIAMQPKRSRVMLITADPPSRPRSRQSQVLAGQVAH